MLTGIIATLAIAQSSGPALLDDLSKKSFQFFWDQSNATTGLTKDRAGNFANDGYTVASTASTGYSLAAYVIGMERGWVTRDQALAKTKKTLAFLVSGKAAKYKGWYYHFVDWNTGARVWNSELSTIDTAILFCGAIMAKEAFKDSYIDVYVHLMFGSIDWKWMLTDGFTKTSSTTFPLSWTPETGFNTYRWTVLSEQAILYVLALGGNPTVPTAIWTAVNRPLITYANRQEIQGGPLFMHEYSHGFLPFSNKRDSLGFDYGVEQRNAVMNARQYCIDNPNHRTGYSSTIWGLSASDSPSGYKAFGAPGWGEDDGTLNPAITVAGIQFDYEDSLAAANAFRATYPGLYGRYGFSNAINPGANWTDPDVIGIDL